MILHIYICTHLICVSYSYLTLKKGVSMAKDNSLSNSMALALRMCCSEAGLEKRPWWRWGFPRVVVGWWRYHGKTIGKP